MMSSPTQEFRLFRLCLLFTFFSALIFIPLQRKIFPVAEQNALTLVYLFCALYPWALFAGITLRRLRIGAVLFVLIHLATDIYAVMLQPVATQALSFMLVFSFLIVFNIILVEWPEVLATDALYLGLAAGLMYWPGSWFGKSAAYYGLNTLFAETSAMIYFICLVTLGTALVVIKRRTEKQLREWNENLNSLVNQKVAEARRADLEARRAQEQLDKILRHTPVGVVICDENIHCLYTNGVHFNVEMNQGVYRELPGNIIPLSLMQDLLKTAHAAQAHARMGTGESHLIGQHLNFKDANQHERMLRYSYVPVMLEGEDGGEPFKRLILITEDITAEEVMRYKLIQADHLTAMGKMAAGLAHEINNPLSVIRIYIEALGKGVHELEKREKIFLVIKDNILRIDRIIKSFLTFGRQEKPSKEWVDLQGVLKNTLELATNLRQFEQIEICTEFSESVPAILADQHRLSQVFVNLLNNARDAMIEKGGKLFIRYAREGDAVLIEFKDTGKGIRAEDLKNIFTPFFTTKEPGQGTGLGLSISYGIIQEHGGTLEADSHEGVGTTFTIRLPIPAQALVSEAEHALPGTQSKA